MVFVFYHVGNATFLLNVLILHLNLGSLKSTQHNITGLAKYGAPSYFSKSNYFTLWSTSDTSHFGHSDYVFLKRFTTNQA